MSISRKCKVEGCIKNKFGHGYCQKHYARISRNGNLETKINMDGLAYHPLRKTYSMMIDRCENTNSTSYPNYGARGIKVCERWRTSFKNFLDDMGERPDGMTLDRIDNDGNYEPSNCRWATLSEQRLNTRIDKRNTSGYTGVCWNKHVNKWQSYFRRRNLGMYESLDKAVEARVMAEEEHKHKAPQKRGSA